MPASTTEFRRKETVVAREDLPGVPAGSRGVVLTSVGLTWERYRVRFENGVEVGSIDVGKLAHSDGRSVKFGAEDSRSTDPRAIRAFVAAIVGVIVAVGTWIWPFEVRPLAVVVLSVACLLAVVLAHRSLDTVASGRRRGLPLAIAALLLGYLGLLFALLGAVWLLTD